MTHLGSGLSAHLDGELGEVERIEVERHLAGCLRCQDDLVSLERVRDLVRSLPVAVPPRDRFTPRRVRWAWAAAASLAAGLLAVSLVVAPGESDATFDLDTLNEQHTARLVADPGIATLRGSGP